MKNLLFISFLISGVVLSFTGCLNTEGGNYQTFPPAPAVVNYNSAKGGTTLLTCWGEIATPALTEYNQDDCLIVQFRLDYNNQPSPDYYTATGIAVIEEVDHSLARIEKESPADDATLPVDVMAVADYNNSILLDGKYFLYFKHQAPKDQLIEYRMSANPETPDETSGAYNIYLSAKKKNEAEGTSTTSQTKSHAFDMKDVIFNLGRDTTVNYIGLKYLKVNLHYLTKEEDGFKFKKHNSTPIELAVRK